MDQDKVLKTLNELIETSENGKLGFAEASDKATDAMLKDELKKRSQQCARASQELQSVVIALGGKPEHEGTVAGAAHRGWVALKAAVGDNNIAVLEEAERGEDHAKAVYGKAMKIELPSSARAVVEKQYEGVMRNHDRIRELRNAYKRAA